LAKGSWPVTARALMNISTLAGTGNHGFSGDNDPAASALLTAPSALTPGNDPNPYVANNGNHPVRRTVPAGLGGTVLGGSTADPSVSYPVDRPVRSPSGAGTVCMLSLDNGSAFR
jgi:hypothetical protein